MPPDHRRPMQRRSPLSAVASPPRSGFRRPPRRQTSPLPPPSIIDSPDPLAAHHVPLPNSPKPDSDSEIDRGRRSSSSSSSSSDTESTSHSGSTSDSETDGSSSDKEGTDCEVDIMSDKEGTDCEVDIMGDDDNQQNATVELKPVASDKTTISKLKRAHDAENFEEKPESVKRSKSPTLAQALFYEKKNFRKCGTEKHNQQLSHMNNCESSVIQRGLSYRERSEEKSEIKGPIKDFTQFEECVHEYREKYAHYRSLNMELENTRNAFLRVKNDLEDAKDKNSKERILLEELKELYVRHGVRHRQQNTIFVLLHEELKNLKGIIWDFAHAYAKE